jgi:hypothetical protein
MSQVSLGSRVTGSSADGATSATPSASTPSSRQARLARVGPRSAPPCFLDPPTMVGPMSFAFSAHALAPRQPFAAMRSSTVSPTVAVSSGRGSGQEK